MTKEEIQKELKGLIEPYVQNKEAFEDLKAETDLLRDLKINSAHLVDIILDMEEAFDIEIDDEAAEKMMTVGEAVAITNKLLQEQE